MKKVIEAIRNNNQELALQELFKIKSNKDINMLDNTPLQNTMLVLCASRGEQFYDVMKQLIKRGINVNKTNNLGTSPLYWASKDGYLKGCKLLIENGANMLYLDTPHQTPFSAAVVNDHEYVLDFMISQLQDSKQTNDAKEEVKKSEKEFTKRISKLWDNRNLSEVEIKSKVDNRLNQIIQLIEKREVYLKLNEQLPINKVPHSTKKV